MTVVARSIPSALLDQASIALLGRAARQAGRAEGPAAILGFVNAVLPFTSCLVTLLAPGRAPVLLYDDIRPERHEAVVDAYLRGAYLLDPFYDFLSGGLERRVIRLQEIQPDHFRKSEYFSTYYTDTRLVDEVGIFVPRRDESHIFVSLGRAARTAPFSVRSFQRLQSWMAVIEALLARQWDAEQFTTAAGAPVTLDDTLQQSGFAALSAREREIVALILKGALVEVDRLAARYRRGHGQEPPQEHLPQAEHHFAVGAVRAVPGQYRRPVRSGNIPKGTYTAPRPRATLTGG